MDVMFTGPKVAFPLAGHKEDMHMTFHVHFTFPTMQHDISHFLPHVMWRIKPNPLHITDAEQMIFLLSVLNMTQEIPCYRICVVQLHDM